MSTAPIESIPAAERRRLVVIGLFRALVTTVVVVALFFTVTVFATVGFGDITATSQVARVVVIAQMILDLLVLGLVVKVFLGAVEKGRERQSTRQDPES